MNTKKDERRKRALKRWEEFLSILEEKYKKIEDKEAAKSEAKHISFIKSEISTLTDILSGKKKIKVDEKGELKVVEKPKERYFMDIYSIHLGYIKNSERRKNKGKSRKKMKKMKGKSFVKSVVLQPGMVQQFREGRMGISPKSHTITIRKEEISLN